MQWLEFADSVIGHLAWPLLVLLLIWLIRPHLKPLVDRILEFSFDGATVKFGQLLTEGTKIVDQSPRDRVRPKQDDAAVEAATTRPVQSIFHSFAGVEVLLEEIGKLMGTTDRNGELMRRLVDEKLGADDWIALYASLQKARNDVAHGRASMPNAAESLEYLRQAKYMDAVLTTVIQELGQKELPAGSADMP
jgi:hypothetical protein